MSCGGEQRANVAIFMTSLGATPTTNTQGYTERSRRDSPGMTSIA